MHIGQRYWRRQGLGTKLAITNFVWVAAILAALLLGIAWSVSRVIQHKVQADLEQGVAMLGRFVEANDRDLRQRTQFLADSLGASLSGQLTLQGEGSQAQLLLNGEPLQGDNARIERFTRATGAVATVFVKQGQDYLRVASSLKTDKGQPATGTLLDHQHPAYAEINAGRSYMGLATLFGRQYMAEYRPLKDASGATVGMAFVGQDFSELLANLKTSIRALQVGDGGYYYVLRSDGPAAGTLVVHPAKEGQSILESKDSDGRAFIREIVERKQGVISYPWANPGEQEPREKLAVFGQYAPWNWVFVASAYKDEAVAETRRLIGMFAAMGLGAVLVLAGVWWLLLRRMIVRPLNEASQLARTIAAGDLTVKIPHVRQDEIGQLLDAMNHTVDGLSSVVRTVQTQAESVAMASAEIAQGNMDLASRTESEASALEETAAAMEELGSTVAHNADHARTADQLARSAEQVVSEGGLAVRQVVQAMQGIDAGSRRIADITGVIDGIAFQTNILALNAAVEAARAGEHGRGFAVVAGEVRALAQRSAEAAKEIQQLISTSVAEVSQGNHRAAQAGQTMEQAVSEIQKVTQLISNISHASAEQSSGVAQVGEAVTNMDQTTQKNAALVEEMAGATASLRQQSEELLQAVSVFRLQGGSGNRFAARTVARQQAAAVIHSAAAGARQSSTVAKPAAPALAPAAAASAPAAARPAAVTATDDNDDWTSF
ncbi:MAG: Cache 3/Cache 2 fusion domain-containing protein [Acidovorax sp.]|jgi:methyl-accepting chemotaxis protein-2 (aspartate sensor receptor)|nr:Cache 3/Cache 2 fusion domain-containing protein [Acidovorax sp.]